MLTAADILKTDPTTVTPQTTVEELGRLFIDTSTTGFAVLNSDGTLFGVVTENDLISQNKALHIPTVLRLFDAYIPLEGMQQFEKDVRKMSATIVRDICTTEVVTAEQDTSIEALATIMAEQKAHHIPILRDGKLMGMVTQHDVIKGIAGDSQNSDS